MALIKMDCILLYNVY